MALQTMNTMENLTSTANLYEAHEAIPSNTLDLGELLITRPAATYFVRVSGDSMEEAGILDNDILIVDRSIKPCHGDTVIASLDGAFTVKVLALKPCLKLIPRNPKYESIVIKEGMDCAFFGVVSGVVRQVSR